MTKSLTAWGMILLLSLAQSLHAQEDEAKKRRWYWPWGGDKDEAVIIVIADPFAEMHTYHGRGYPIFHVVEKNEKIRIIKNRFDWFLVETEDKKKGWIKRDQLKNTLDEQGHLLSFANPGWTDYKKNRIRASLLGSRFDKATAYTVSLGYQATENFTYEIKFTQAFGEFSNLKLGSGHIIHQPFPQWRVSPFVSLGAGIIQTFPDSILVEAEDREDRFISAGGGLMYYFSHRLMLRLEYTNHNILTTRVLNEEVEEWKAGFSVLF